MSTQMFRISLYSGLSTCNNSVFLGVFFSVFEASQSLFWASFGMVGLENFELAGIKSYTRFWGLLMFGSYSVINVIVLLNLLIAMMSNSYAMIDVSTYIIITLLNEKKKKIKYFGYVLF